MWLFTVALAHEPGLSTLTVTADAATWAGSPRDAALLDAASRASDTVIRVDAAPCVAGAPRTTTDGDDTVVTWSLDCPTGARWSIEPGWVDAMPAGHRVYVSAFGDDAVLSAASEPFEVGAAPQTGAVGAEFLTLGVEHIVTGFDHLAFLLGVLVAARGARDMLALITSFTVAHSVTLCAAGLGMISAPSAWIEPAIALSVAWVGLENLVAPAGPRRVATTFAVGLLHGFGFAGMLAELGLPAEARWVGLGAFNLGVEVGQLALAAVALPALLWLRRQPTWDLRFTRLASAALVAVGLLWFGERVW